MVIKRYSHILTAIKKGKSCIYVRKYREWIIIDEEVKIIIKIIENEQTKKSFFNKIYQCCIYKGLVSYEEILNMDIG